VAAAVTATASACSDWAAPPPLARSNVLQRAATLIRAEVQNAADVFDYYAGRALSIVGDTLLAGQSADSLFTLRVPVGVTAAITPWSFPINIPAVKLAAALAFGNVVVFKPAEQAPATSIQLVRTLYRAGLAPCAVTVLLGHATQ
jgi:alpha-ketoglutaric semialdehyde dehydrogenase